MTAAPIRAGLSGPVEERGLAASTRLRPPRAARAAARDAARGRPGARAEAAAARARDASATCSSAARAATSRRPTRSRSPSSGASEEVAIAGTVDDGPAAAAPRRRLTIVTARVADGTGRITANWFNQPWLADRLAPGTGRAPARPARHATASRFAPTTSVRRAPPPTTLPSTAPASRCRSSRLRELVRVGARRARPRRARPAAGRARAPDPPRRARRASTSRPTSPRPSSRGSGSRSTSSSRCSSPSLRSRGERAAPGGRSRHPASSSRATAQSLPFTLTEHQEPALAEIDADLARDVPMQRLLQGDVGSGKTVVALYALLRAVEAGRQAALMAPTETLAEQHFLTIEGLCAELGVRVVLLTGSSRRRRWRAPRSRAGAAQIAVGTHALIQRGVALRRPRRRGRRRAAPLRGRAARRRSPTLAPARPAHDRDADPAHARADRLRRPRRDRDRQAAREPQADHHRLGRGRALERGLRAAARASRRRPAGLRRLPADRGLGDAACARRGGGGRAAAAGRARRLPRRAPARPAEGGRAPRGDGAPSRPASSTSSSRRP